MTSQQPLSKSQRQVVERLRRGKRLVCHQIAPGWVRWTVTGSPPLRVHAHTVHALERRGLIQPLETYVATPAVRAALERSDG